ncbi:MAG: cytidine deaminase [Actinomycetota bacterium]|jgi:cytidine deaminase|nr:cytidine deaminase [Actinomycetota bacterium]
MTNEELVAEARAAAEKAYAPYSNYRVGAVAVAEDGTHYTGANVENSAYGSSICAEASAIAHAVSSGVRKIDTVAVSCLDADEPGYPCGNCRQLMVEFGVARVIVDGFDAGPIEHTREELIPHGFRL